MFRQLCIAAAIFLAVVCLALLAHFAGGNDVLLAFSATGAAIIIARQEPPPSGPTRFGLRTLLILATLLCVVLGLLAMRSR